MAESQARLPARRRAPFFLLLFGALVAVIAGITLTHHDDSRERVMTLSANLNDMRGAIKSYRARYGHGPKSLDELVAAKFLREVPVDPITNSRTTWRVVTEEAVTVANDDFSTARAAAPQPPHAEIVDVRSGAKGAGPDGRAWSEY